MTATSSTLTGSGSTQFVNIERLRLEGGPGNNRLDATAFEGDVVLVGGGGNDELLGGNGNDQLEGQAGNDTVRGGLGDDTYVFSGIGLGADMVQEDSQLNPDTSEDALDFFGFSDPVSINLSSIAAQQISPGLTLTLSDAAGLEVVIGSANADTIIGNERDNTLIGAGGEDSISGAGGDDLIQAAVVKTVFLDFDTATDGDELEYSPIEREGVQRLLEQDFAAFGFSFTQTAPTDGNFVTILFNRTPRIGGRLQAGGLSGEIGWRSLVLNGNVLVDVNGFFGFGVEEARIGSPLPLETAEPDGFDRTNFIQLSTTIAGHELAHFFGLRHHDAIGPAGAGLFAELGAGRFLPKYPELIPQTAEETRNHLIASPAAVKTTLADALRDPFLSEREAIKMAFAETGMLIPEAVAATTTRMVSIDQDGGQAERDRQGLGGSSAADRAKSVGLHRNQCRRRI